MVLRCECAGEDIRCEKQWERKRAEEIKLSEGVNQRQGDESLGRDGQILTWEVTAVSCSLSQAWHSPHACNIIHAYHTCKCMCTLDHTAYIILTSATVVVLRSFLNCQTLVPRLLHGTQMQILNFK